MPASLRLPLPSLPLPLPSHILTRNLTPDSVASDPSTFHGGVLPTRPSIQRRARRLEEAAHYTHVTPLPLPFPYRIEVEEDIQDNDKTKAVEQWLSAREALKVVEVGPATLKAYSSDNRSTDYELLGIAPGALNDCLPALDVGDAFEYIGAPALSANAEKTDQKHAADGDALGASGETEESQQRRQILTDVLSGHTVLLDSSEENGYAPWSLRYSGHQFGTWAGQLGDGRAISILETPHPNDPNLIYELQLKGAGRTPFSRGADGLAVLRSSIREYLGAEAVHALNIPTTRSLALISYPNIPVKRESPIPEKAAIVTRVAPSFLRIGNFESFNPPPNVFIFSLEGQQNAHWDGLRILGEWVSRRVLLLNLGPGKDGKPPAWGKELVLECARRNARMAAGWQAYGFMHGVINTDNVSMLGLTMDYGPYAFMDVFSDNHICNHTDEEGRYAYKYQPTMIVYALRALLTSLSPLIGAEIEFGHAVPAGWANDVTKEKLENWTEDGLELREEVEATVMDTFTSEYMLLMRKRLGLRKEVDTDLDRIIRSLLLLMEIHQLDFHLTLRILTSFRPSSTKADLEGFAAHLTPESIIPSDEARERARSDLIQWLDAYSKRIVSERDEWESSERWLESRETEMRKVNPRFVLRQWVLEDVIEKVDKDFNVGRRILAKVLEMASHPFDAWGAEGHTGPDDGLSEEIKEERRYCGVGPQRFLGFQCSCSS